jgi:hypothetical protein
MRYVAKAIALGSLTLTAVTAQAETICKKCAYQHPDATYLGAYSPGDRGTFVHADIAGKVGQFTSFDNYWVFDVTETISWTTITLTALDVSGFRTELYENASAQCDATRCTLLALGTDIMTIFDASKYIVRMPLLSPGRYVLRFVSTTTEAGSYTGRLTLRN